MLTGQPVIILKDDVERTRGRDALHSNIMAAKAIAGAVRTTLGPRGMDKMLVSPSGDVVITNDGATILHELSVQHPAAKMMVEVAEAQDDEVGDGTTTACVLVGKLLEEAEDLVAQEVHPTIIAKGFRMGMEEALRILNGMAIEISPDDRESLIKIADTAMTGKSIEAAKDKIREIVVDAVTTVATRIDDRVVVDEDDVMIKKQVGETMDGSVLVRGVVIDKKRVNAGMPRVVTDAKVALISTPLEVVKTQVKSKIKITSPEQMEAFDAQEKESLKGLADGIGPVLSGQVRHPGDRGRSREGHEVRCPGPERHHRHQGRRPLHREARIRRAGGGGDRRGSGGHLRLREPEGGHHPPPRLHPELRGRAGAGGL